MDRILPEATPKKCPLNCLSNTFFERQVFLIPDKRKKYMKEFLDYTLFKIGKYELKVASILLLIVFVFIVRVLLRLIKKSIDKTSRIEVQKKYALFSLIKYVIIVFSIIASFQILGFDLSLLLAGSAALLVGVGLGLQ